ncbi:MAG: M16 family metallopeptidase, partial [Bryobacteraceae bacterium]
FYATRLYRELREKTGLVYTVNDSLSASQTRASYSVSYGCDPKNVSKARAIVQRQLADMRKYNVSPTELQQAKALLLRQIPLSESSEDAVAGGFMGRAVIGLPLDEPEHAAKRYFGMTADQVRAAFAQWVDPNNFVQVVRGPAPH